MSNKIKISQLPLETNIKEDSLIAIVQDNDTKAIKSKDLLKTITSDMAELEKRINKQVEDIANNGTTAEALGKAIKEEVDRQVAAGTIIANGSITKEKLDPNIKFGIEDGEVTSEKIANEAITNEKVSSISIEKLIEANVTAEHGLNLYNKETMYEQGHWTENGVFDTSANHYSTGYIEVEPSKKYSKSGARISSDNSLNTTIGEPIAFFDENKNLIRPVIRTNTFTTPANCKYINTLVWKPNFEPSDSRLQQYPHSVTRDKLLIVEGDLPQEYSSYSKLSYDLYGLNVKSSNIEDGAITAKHIAPDCGLGTVYAGRMTPPESAVLWFIPPMDEEEQETDFISDKLMIYIDGRFGANASSIINNGSAGGQLTIKRNAATPNAGFKADNLWYVLEPGCMFASKKPDNNYVNPEKFEGEDITIMVRCKVPQAQQSPLVADTCSFDMGSDPTWTGFYIKPFYQQGRRLQLDARAGGVYAAQKNHDTLLGKDVVFTVRKSGTKLDMFINKSKCGTYTHAGNTIQTWKGSSNFNCSIAMGSIGSALVYSKALTDEEIFQNIATEVSVRGELSTVNVYDTLNTYGDLDLNNLDVKGDINDKI